MNEVIRAAAVNWEIAPVTGWGDFEQRFLDVVAHAEAELVVLPEYTYFELLTRADIPEDKVLAELLPLADDYTALAQRAAHTYGCTIVAGSIFQSRPEGITNATPIVTPDGKMHWQPKVRLTQYEKDMWHLAPGTGLETGLNPIGVTICYDVEFPEATRLLAEHGTLILCVPSWTETSQSALRVRWSAQGRAVENQQFVIHSTLRGQLGREPLPFTHGTSAIIAPPVDPFVEPILNESGPGMSYARADLDLTRLLQARQGDDVRNWADRHPLVWEVLPPSSPSD